MIIIVLTFQKSRLELVYTCKLFYLACLIILPSFYCLIPNPFSINLVSLLCLLELRFSKAGVAYGVYNESMSDYSVVMFG